MAFPVDARWIQQAEAELGRALPPWLRNRLMAQNGGTLRVEGEPWPLHPVFDGSDRKRTARTANHIVLETREARKWRTFPADAIAIAKNGFGDQIVLRADSDVPEFWDHEAGEVLPVATDWGH